MEEAPTKYELGKRKPTGAGKHATAGNGVMVKTGREGTAGRKNG